MKDFLASIAALFLAASAPPPEQPRGVDEYRFETAEFTNHKIVVHFVFVDSYEELAEMPPTTPGLRGRTWMQPGSNRCIVFIVKPSQVYDPQWLGHEIAHCIHGQWHPNQTSAGQ